MITENRKLIDSGIIDCTTQAGQCGLNSPECFFNLSWKEYALPRLPNPDYVNEHKLIVRVNPVHDSNTLTTEQWEQTSDYTHRFYNTRIAKFTRFDFPIVYTYQQEKGLYDLLEQHKSKIMFVRLMVEDYHFEQVMKKAELSIIQDVLHQLGIQTVATFMRYSKKPLCEQYYHVRWGIEHTWWMPRPEAIIEFMLGFEGTGLFTCGSLHSSLCVDCGNCKQLYWRWVRLYG